MPISRNDLGIEHAPYGIPLHSLRAVDGATLGVAEDTADLLLVVSSNVHSIRGRTPETATEAAAAVLQFPLPSNYVPAGALEFVITCQFIDGAGADAGRASTVDCAAFLQTDGAVGSDLVTTAATAFAAGAGGLDTYVDFPFTVDPAGLSAGQILNFLVTFSAVADNANPTQIEGVNPRVLLD